MASSTSTDLGWFQTKFSQDLAELPIPIETLFIMSEESLELVFQSFGLKESKLISIMSALRQVKKAATPINAMDLLKAHLDRIQAVEDTIEIDNLLAMNDKEINWLAGQLFPLHETKDNENYIRYLGFMSEFEAAKAKSISTLALSSSSFDPAIRVKCREEYVSEAIQIFNEFKQKALESKEKKTIQEFIGENIETYDKIEEFQELVFNDQLPKNLRKFKDQHQLLEPERNNSILADQYNLPALLLHNLDQLDDQAKEKSKKIYEEVLKSEKYPNLAFLIGPSGSGKTRTALEFLTSYFGLFFTANTISNGGSLDLEDLLRSNSQGGSSSMSVLLEFLNLVFTRVAFLNGLRKKYKEKFKPWHWMVIQEMPRSIFGGKDVFIDIASNFKSMHVIDLVINNTSASSLLELTNEPSQLFVIFIDESQDLLANSNHCSASFLQDLISAIRSKHKPLVKTYDSNKPLLNSLMLAAHYLFPDNYTSTTQTKLLLCLSGTGLQVQEIETSAGSSVLKRFKERVYITLGNFLEYTPFQRYVQSYTRALDDRLHELHSILRGRYRITAAFLANYLNIGDVERALSKVRKHLKQSIVKPISYHVDMDYEHETSEVIVSKYVNSHKFLQKMMLLYLLFDSTIQALDSNSVDEIKHIQYGLALVSSSCSKQIEVFSDTQSLSKNLKIAEPLIFELLHNSLSSVTYMKKIYVDNWAGSLELVGSFHPTSGGKLSEPYAASLFINILEQGKIDQLNNYRPMRRVIDELDVNRIIVRAPFSVNCSQMVQSGDGSNSTKMLKYSIEDFLSQDFVNRKHTYIGAYPQQVRDAFDFLLVVEEECDSKTTPSKYLPLLVIMEFKKKNKNETTDCNSLKAWHEEITKKKWKNKFSDIFYIFLQMGNDLDHSALPKFVRLYKLSDLENFKE